MQTSELLRKKYDLSSYMNRILKNENVKITTLIFRKEIVVKKHHKEKHFHYFCEKSFWTYLSSHIGYEDSNTSLVQLNSNSPMSTYITPCSYVFGTQNDSGHSFYSKYIVLGLCVYYQLNQISIKVFTKHQTLLNALTDI